MCSQEDDPSMHEENYCIYGHYEEGNTWLPECINEMSANNDPRLEDEIVFPTSIKFADMEVNIELR